MRILMLVLAWLIPTAALAQALDTPHAELPSAREPVRRVPVTSYTLALSWAPEYCFAHRGQERSGECSGPAARGFTLHGLWPDGGADGQWPQYCHPVAILNASQLRAGLRATPSPQLLQHEWAKHGSCTGSDPVRYFTEEGRLFASVRPPEMAALAARRDLTAGAFKAAFAAANPGMTPAMVRLNVSKQGWLEEVWLCLGLDERPRACGPGQGGGAADAAPIKLARPGGRASRPWLDASGAARSDGPL